MAIPKVNLGIVNVCQSSRKLTKGDDSKDTLTPMIRGEKIW